MTIINIKKPGEIKKEYRIIISAVFFLSAILLAFSFKPAELLFASENVTPLTNQKNIENIHEADLFSGETDVLLYKPARRPLKQIWHELNLVWEAKIKLLYDIKRIHAEESNIYKNKKADIAELFKLWEERNSIHENELAIREKSLELARESEGPSFYENEQLFWEALFHEWEKTEQIHKRKNISIEDLDGIYEEKKIIWIKETGTWEKELISIRKDNKHWENILKKEYGEPYLIKEKTDINTLSNRATSDFIKQFLMEKGKALLKIPVLKPAAYETENTLPELVNKVSEKTKITDVGNTIEERKPAFKEMPEKESETTAVEPKEKEPEGIINKRSHVEFETTEEKKEKIPAPIEQTKIVSREL